MAKKSGNFLYKIYYGDILVYLGRTTMPLEDRLRGHILKRPNMREIDIDCITKVEYAEFKTIADMYLYEVYFINLLKPPLNKDDKAKDALTIILPEVKFTKFSTELWERWIAQKREKSDLYQKRKDRLAEIQDEMSRLRTRRRNGQIGEEKYYSFYEPLAEERANLKELI